MTLNKVLIANRGEIAGRVIRACRELGLDSVAVYSDADREAPYVRQADEAYYIGPAEARASYLNAVKIIETAKRAGADAIHPGYGFLAENAAFAEACGAAGLRFVGPSAKVIAEMGSKIAAKAAAQQAGVPVVPGFDGADQSDEKLIAEARRLGLPLLVKASAGGGGRGMRRVCDLDELPAELAAARREAEAAFGDAALLLERFIKGGRHVEVQLLCDCHGTALHLFERDCSIQRNHQKIIEEAPAPDLPAAVRQAMLDSAVRLAAAIGYDSVGTVEYIYDPKAQNFFFLEMNTRLQVEHPVTEMVTGLDLVEWQLRVAGGERLPFAQADVRCDGWAMEARLSAEDPAQGYRPQTGRITSYAEPSLTQGRVDSGVCAGVPVTHHYDSLLAKVITRGRDRETARRRLVKALSQMSLGGVTVNRAFLADVLTLPAFAAAAHHTETLSETWPQGWRAPALDSEGRAEAAVIKLMDLELMAGEAAQSSPWSSLGAWRVTERVGRKGSATFHLRDPDGTVSQIRVTGRGGDYEVLDDDGGVYAFKRAEWREGVLRYEREGRCHSRRAAIEGPSVMLARSADSVTIEVLSGEEVLLGRRGASEGGDGQIVAPMPGLVAEVKVAQGERVSAGQPLIALEAMKLLQDLTAPRAGVVAAIRHAAGDTVDSGTVLLTIAPSD